MVVDGCKWRDLSGDLPPWQTVYTYFRNWRKDGAWEAIHTRLRGWARAVSGRPESPSEVIIDSQSVPTATMVHQAVGYDGGKNIKGRKRHAIVDTLGLLMIVLVTAASTPERAGIKQAFQKLMALKPQVARLYLVCGPMVGIAV